MIITGRLFAEQWLRYRYGVFEETGQVGNVLHPPHYRSADSTFKPTTCSNVPLKEKLMCDPHDVSCQISANAKDNPDLKSSFMAHSEMEHVSH